MRKDYEFLIKECEIEERDAIADSEDLDDILLGKRKIIDVILSIVEQKNRVIDVLRKIKELMKYVKDTVQIIIQGGKGMVRGITVEEEIKRIEEFFSSLTIEEFEQMCIENGIKLKDEEDKYQQILKKQQ